MRNAGLSAVLPVPSEAGPPEESVLAALERGGRYARPDPDDHRRWSRVERPAEAGTFKAGSGSKQTNWRSRVIGAVRPKSSEIARNRGCNDAVITGHGLNYILAKFRKKIISNRQNIAKVQQILPNILQILVFFGNFQYE